MQRDRPKLPSLLLCLATMALGLLLIGCAGTDGTSENPKTNAVSKTQGAGATEKDAFREDTLPGAVGEEARMSVRDMVGQMFVVGMSGTEPDYYIKKMVRERNVGGVLLFGYNMQSEEQTRALTKSLQELSLATEPSIPLFMAVDQEGGEISSAPWVTPQPAAAEVGSRGDTAEAREVAEQIGRELRRAGVNTDFAPVVDTGFGSAIGARSYGEDPALVARMGAAAVEGFKAAGVVSAAKHFPNHGVATVDSHVGLPVVEHDLETINSYDLPPFRAAVRAGVPIVMAGHLVYPTIDPDLPASLSLKVISMLRESLRFDGVVVTDDLAMAGVSGGGPPSQAAVAAVKAGADLLVISSPPQQQADAYEAVVKTVESGEISRERIETSFRRIKKVKDRYPLYEKLTLG